MNVDASMHRACDAWTRRPPRPRQQRSARGLHAAAGAGSAPAAQALRADSELGVAWRGSWRPTVYFQPGAARWRQSSSPMKRWAACGGT